MQYNTTIHTVSCHAEGEVGDVITAGVPVPPGKTLWQQRTWIADNGALRNFMLNEPRGGVFRHVNLLVPPTDPMADAAWIIMEPEDTPPMSGSNSICVATVLLETGILPMQEPITHLTLQAPGGLISVQAQCVAGKVTKVTLENLPSFAAQLDVTLNVPGLGNIRVDTAFGGDSFVIVDAIGLGFDILPQEAHQIVEIGLRITKAANDQLGFHHPTQPDWKHISFCQIAGPLYREGKHLAGRNAVVIQPGKIDRSPCGTGLSARMAVLHAKGQMQVNDKLIGRSIIGSCFEGQILGRIAVGEHVAIRPAISGQGWITGTHQHTIDPTDPWPQGYRISDTWPEML